jgi:hypothetical protein
MIDSPRDSELDDGRDDDELDTSPFFDYLRTQQGHEIASRAVSIIEDVKKAALSHSASNARLEKWLQIAIVVAVIAASTYLTATDKFNPTIGVLFGTLVGYVFGKRA